MAGKTFFALILFTLVYSTHFLPVDINTDLFQLWIDGSLQGTTWTRDLSSTLTLNTNSQAYVGFSGGTGGSYMQQRIYGWTFTSTPSKLS